MLKRKLLVAALLASSIGIIPAAASAAVGIYLDVAPPAPRYEVVPAPRAGYVWAPGFWDWRGGRHVWVRGHWERERHGYHWNPSRWEEHDGRWVLNRGGWDRAEHLARGDHDHDGVPDRFDRAPNNPYRQ
ncbi:MAG: YXWGXW repeat-containing protein [Usitatibacter sp.]